MPGGQAQAAGHLLEAHLAAVLVGAGRGERTARHARGSGGLNAALGAGAAARTGVRPRAPLGLAVGIEHRALGADRALGDEAVVAAELRHAGTSESSGLTPCLPMRTAVVSDLHLGALGGADVAREGKERDALLDAIKDADRLVLLGDVIELRERPLAESLEVARPVFEELGRALAGRPRGARAGQPRPRLRRAVARAAAAGCAGPGDRDGVAGRPGRRRRRPDRRLDAGRGAQPRLSGPSPARRRLRDPRALPRPSPHDPAAGVDRGVGDGAL